MFAGDPVEEGIKKAKWRAAGRAFVGFFTFACIWGVVGLLLIIGLVGYRHAMFVGFAASVAYALYREHRRRRDVHATRIERRRRFRAPLTRPRRQATTESEGGRPAASQEVPKVTPDTRDKHTLSKIGWGDVMLWLLLILITMAALHVAGFFFHPEVGALTWA